LKQMLEGDLHGYVDGRLDRARRCEVEDWLAQHPAERARVDDWRRQKEALHGHFDPVLDELVPDRLQHARVPGGSRWWGIAAAAAWLAVGAVVGFVVRGQGEAPATAAQAGAGLARQAALAHAVFVPEVKHPVEVGAEQEAHLVQWLSKRLGTTVRAPDLQAAGYSLMGGRLLPADAGPAAQFMYQDRAGRRVTLYVRSDTAGGETAFRYAREDGLAAFYWIDRNAGYALTGDLPRQELLALAEAAYRDLERKAGGG
jgi:anti-sigma factor RsiW